MSGSLLDRVCFSGFKERVVIYGIRAVDSDLIVYVGSTSQNIKDRIRAHVGSARKASPLPVHKWMVEQSFTFCVVLLAECSINKREDFEKRIIAEISPRLNVTDGGAGMSGHKFAGTDHARRIGESLRSGDNFYCEVCGAQFWRKAREIKLGNNRFCSKECYQKWQIGKPKKRRPL